MSSEGDYEAVDGVDQPGWFRRTFTLSNLSLNSIGPRSLIPACLMLLPLCRSGDLGTKTLEGGRFGLQGVVAIVCICAVGLFVLWTVNRIYSVQYRYAKLSSVRNSLKIRFCRKLNHPLKRILTRRVKAVGHFPLKWWDASASG